MNAITRTVSISGVLAAAGLAVLHSPQRTQATNDPYASLPSELEFTGVVRDFRERSVPGGHPDFERAPSGGFGQYYNMVMDELDSDGKPQFKSTGNRISSQWRDASNRNILNPRPYISPRPGDIAGSMSMSAVGALTNADNFRSWFRDVPGINVSRQLTLKAKRNAGSSVYTFDDKQDPFYQARNGFFPINNELFGNSGGSTPQRNHHFTYELETEFVYESGKGQVFRFTGDDDVWVFIDGKLVIDIGGVHGAVSQVIELDRLNWLENGRSYKLKFFFAERHRTQSNFRIETTMQLRSVNPPATSNLFD